MKGLEQFQKDMLTNEELRKQFSEAIKKACGKGTSERDAIFEIAREMGYEFSASDLDRYMAESHSLSEEELELVSGGGLCELHYGCILAACWIGDWAPIAGVFC